MKTAGSARAVQKLALAGEIIPAADALAFFNNLLVAYSEHQKTLRDVEKIRAVKELILTDIANRHELYHDLFNRIFDERKSAIDRHFQIIDRGITSNDKDLIIRGLEGLSKIVSSSPFANIDQLRNLLESGQPIQI